jgi:hypothetical protein
MPSILADVVWPALSLQSGLLSIPVILAGLVIEYFFVWRLTNLGVGWSILADVAMNAGSTLLGIFLIPVAGIAWEVFPGLILYHWLHWGTFSPITWGATFFMAVLINAALETLVLAKGFKQKIGKRGFAWLCLANGITVAIAMVTLAIRPPGG